MSRKTSRVLAMGLLTSSIVVMALGVWSPKQLQSTQAQSSNALVDTVTELEEKTVILEQENTRLSEEVDRLSEGYSNNLSLDDFEDEDEPTSKSEEEESEDVDSNQTDSVEGSESTESVEEKISEYTVTVKEGEPSSVVAEQLESLGLIEDRHAFNAFLEKYDYAKKVRPGNYVVSTDMNNTEMALALVQ